MGPRNDPTPRTMNQHAEYVSPGHPDRLADAIAESIVTAAVRQEPDALVGVEVAVHTRCVFVDGRIAAGSQPVDIEKIVRPEGDNGLSGKKLVIDHYGPGVPIGGGALSGKDPHKVDKCGALRARQLAKKLVRGGVDEASVTLGWSPGDDAPFLVEASDKPERRGPAGAAPRIAARGMVQHQGNCPRSGTDSARLGGGSAGRLPLPSLCSLGGMSTAAIMKSQTPFPVPPYLIATRSYNLRRIMIALGAVIAERHSRDRLAWIFMEMIVIRGFDLSSYCSRSRGDSIPRSRGSISGCRRHGLRL
jgi:hypothetical protein